ncbi:hypothetical protein [Nostoc sp. LEGE 12447]|uniref:hypothetical protein n=1 Tax=Nostoc sp. LEGE 12447 TaxID=1828640 RepID=UPI001883A207|nr:hypothetical protein [Nostoc sp. LEGE 12447]
MNKKQFEQMGRAIALQKKLLKPRLGNNYPSSSQPLETIVEPCNFIKSQNQYT